MAENTESWTKLESDSRYPRKYEFEELEQVVSNLQQLDFVDYKGTVDNYAELSGLTGLENGDAYVNLDDGLVYAWNGTSFPAEGDGLDVSMKPIGVVEEGNEFAVSGGDVYDSIIELSDESYENIYSFNAYIHKNTGVRIDNNGYRSTYYLRINDLDNLIVSGRSGLTNNVALAAFYDRDFNFLGSVNAGSNGNVIKYKIDSALIPTGSFYVIFTKEPPTPFYISGVDKVVKLKTNFDYIEDVVRTNNEVIYENTEALVISEMDESYENIYSFKGFINKNDGSENLSPTSTYRSTYFLRLTDRDNLIVNGMSGLTNNVALISFFDKDLNFIGYYNYITHGNVEDVKVPVSSIPEEAYFIRSTKEFDKPYLLTGVDKANKLKSSMDYVDARIRAIDIDVDFDTRRTSVPNVNVGGEIKLTNYLGNYQNIHPKVLYFSTAWNGHKYWMAYTPYPGGSTLYENPCVAFSDDGEIWTDIANNPITDKPSTGYNSDTHLVFREDLNRLELWYRPVDTGSIGRDRIVRKTSTNGIDWTPTEEVIFDWETPGMLSPAVIFEDGKYKFWCCGWGTKAKREVLYTETIGDDVNNWDTLRAIDIPPFGTELTAWHIDVISTDLGVEMVVQAYGDGGNNNTSDLYYVLFDGTTYTTPRIIIQRGDESKDVDYNGVYRSSILKINGIYYIYYTGIAGITSYRAIYLSKGRNIDKLRGVNL